MSLTQVKRKLRNVLWFHKGKNKKSKGNNRVKETMATVSFVV